MLQCLSLRKHHVGHSLNVEIDKIGQALVGRLCFDAIREQAKVLQVDGHDDLGANLQRRGGHEDWLRNDKVPPVLLAFFRGEDVSGRDVDMPELHVVNAADVPAFMAKLGESRGHLALEFYQHASERHSNHG